jgi:UDP-N-acetylmuramate dehydrogenase
MNVQENVLLGRYTTIGVGGPARWFAQPETLDELVELLAWADRKRLPVAVVGLGSNLLVADEGFAGLALRLVGALAAVQVGATDGSEARLSAGGGAALAVCLHRARDAGLGGLEFACAIPGTVGGAVWMNAGAYGDDLSGILVRAQVVTGDGARWLTPCELGMRYRESDLRRGQVVATAELELVRRPIEEIRSRTAELQARRKAAQPTNRRTFGSVFKNPAHELTAGQLLDACSLRGYRAGGAQISPKHANFVENAGGATAVDVLALIAEARLRALERFGVALETEVQLLGPIEIPPLQD